MVPVLALENIPSGGALLTYSLVFLLLVFLSAFMSGSEVALIGFSKLRRRQLLEEKHPRIAAVEKLLSSPQRFLITILIVNTLVNILAAAMVTAVVQDVFENYGVAIATGFVTFMMLTFGEIAPKAYAATRTEAWALRVAPALLLLQRLLLPLVWAYDKFTAALFKSMGSKGEHGAATIRSEEEMKTLITMGAEEGVLEEKEEDMLHSVIEFSETTAKEVMVPRIDMTAVPGDATLDAIRAYVLDSGFSRIPVYQGTVDNVIGILYVKDLLLHIVEKKVVATSARTEETDARVSEAAGPRGVRASSAQVRDLMREAYYVPESKKLDDLLSEMREKRIHMAIVIDEFGGTAGMITLEDIIEEIVGDIFDEYDLRADPVRQLDEMTAIVDARTHVADVNDALDVEIPEDQGYDTVAGFIYHELGRLGKEGEVVHGPGFDMVVEKVSNRRILRARFVKHKAPGPADEEGTALAP